MTTDDDVTINDYERVDIREVVRALKHRGGAKSKRKKFINTDQIPLICVDIKNLRENVNRISNSMSDHALEMREKVNEISEMIQGIIDRERIEHDKFVTKEGDYKIVRGVVFAVLGITLLAMLGKLLLSIGFQT